MTDEASKMTLITNENSNTMQISQQIPPKQSPQTRLSLDVGSLSVVFEDDETARDMSIKQHDVNVFTATFSKPTTPDALKPHYRILGILGK